MTSCPIFVFISSLIIMIKYGACLFLHVHVFQCRHTADASQLLQQTFSSKCFIFLGREQAPYLDSIPVIILQRNLASERFLMQN